MYKKYIEYSVLAVIIIKNALIIDFQNYFTYDQGI